MIPARPRSTAPDFAAQFFDSEVRQFADSSLTNCGICYAEITSSAEPCKPTNSPLQLRPTAG